MGMTGTMKSYGRAARFGAEAMGHRLKDRMLERRLDRAHQEVDRLRFENGMLRDEVEESRTEHHRILDVLEERLPEDGDEERSHRGRWLLFLLAIAGGAYALVRQMRQSGADWVESEPSTRMADRPA